MRSGRSGLRRDLHARDYEGTSQYHSLQMTLSRQTGERLQYFAA